MFIYKRREVMVCAPTGSGKTLAFVLPILHHLKKPSQAGVRALVLAPTRELAMQVNLFFKQVLLNLSLLAHADYHYLLLAHAFLYKMFFLTF